MRCCVPDCLNNTSNGSEANEITFHRFPTELHLKNRWMEALGIIGWEPEESSLVCSEHFQRDAFYQTNRGVRRVRREALPVSDIEIFSVLETKQIKLEESDEMVVDSANVEIKQEIPDDNEIAGSFANSAIVQPNEKTLNAVTNAIKQEMVIENSYVLLGDEIKQEIHDDGDIAGGSKYNCNKTSPNQNDPLVTVIPEQLNALKICASEEEYTDRPNEYLQKSSEDKDEEYFSCKLCDFRGSSESDLLAHTLIHNTTVPLACQYCDYRCIEKRSLTRHIIQTHSDEKRVRRRVKRGQYECNVCDFSSNEKISFIQHMEYHTAVKPFHCEFCDYSHSRKEFVARHEKIHVGKKLHVCQSCNYKTSEKRHLATHMLIHTGEKPFACVVCDYKCRALFRLKLHMMVHTGEKPLRCEICDYRCRYKSGLDKHMKLHVEKGSYTCNVCLKRFNQEILLTQHKSIHDHVKMYECKFCTYSSPLKWITTKHELAHIAKND